MELHNLAKSYFEIEIDTDLVMKDSRLSEGCAALGRLMMIEWDR